MRVGEVWNLKEQFWDKRDKEYFQILFKDTPMKARIIRLEHLDEYLFIRYVNHPRSTGNSLELERGDFLYLYEKEHNNEEGQSLDQGT